MEGRAETARREEVEPAREEATPAEKDDEMEERKLNDEKERYVMVPFFLLLCLSVLVSHNKSTLFTAESYFLVD